MANEARESDGYTIPPETQSSLDAAARDYSYEVFVKARLIADGRDSDTVTPEDVSLAVASIPGDADNPDYVRLSKRLIQRVLISTTGVLVGALAAYFIARSSPGELGIASTAAALLSAAASVAVASLNWMKNTKLRTQAPIPRHSERERKMLLVQAWASIEGKMYEELEERGEGRSSRTLPLRSLIEKNEKIKSLGPEFRRSLSGLIEARNRIVHGMPYDLSEERYQLLMNTARQVSRALASYDQDEDDTPHS
ncbi:hypothetical protein [Streptomyces atroolivaceus]|uniref:hypothetical protein n=1 Tax=Streptomyces atroolivaceus TaxID=66869 RepID=UPI003443F430